MKFINFKNEKLFLDECEIESPKENQIQIEVHSTGVNRADILQKKGHYPPPKGESEIIGLECAGIVCKIGPNSSKFKVGDKVCAILGSGGYAEFVNVDERQVMPITSNVSLLEAGALPETILTVYENIFNISEFKNMVSNKKSGKAFMKLPNEAQLLKALKVREDHVYIAAVSNIGRLLIFEINELPVLPKGKGNKIINIPTPKFLAKEEYMAHAQLISPSSSLRIESGKRFLTLKLKDLENYISSRAKRGNMLPQGYRKVDNMIEEVESILAESEE